MLRYRPEIDGLRGLAVLAVIFYHASINLFSGGYVGVDVFFVISGYLITSIILNDLETGKFSLSDFYERRARRILPALFLVMFSCLPFAWFLLLPDALEEFSSSLISVSTFVSNFLFWRSSGYFDSATELKPLIHTWSLAVEEQYYTLFPLFLIIAWKFGRRWVLVSLTILFGISLATAQQFSITHPSFNFFMLPTRGWELLIGAFIALHHSRRNIKPFKYYINQIGSSAGLLLIIYSIFGYGEQTPVPSVYMLAPTLGTALIISFATNKTLVGKLLGSKLFVSLGLISYSAYLWHQPMFAFARVRSLDAPSMYLMSTLVILSFAFAYLSWKFVEAPFRKKQFISRKKLIAYGALCTSFFIGIGLAGHIGEGFAWRYPATAMLYIKKIDANWSSNVRIDKCHLQDINLSSHDKSCIEFKNPLIALWGDSHAASLYPGIKFLQNDNKFGVIQLTEAGCGPIFYLDELIYRKNCNLVNENNLEILENAKPNILILHGAWSHPDYRLTNQELKSKFDSTIKIIKRKIPHTKIIIVGPVPRWRISPQRESFNYWMRMSNKEDPVPMRLKAILLLDTEKILQEIAAQNSIQYISAINSLCNDHGCVVRIGDNDTDFIQYDSAHLTKTGSEYFIMKIKNEIF